MDSRSIVLTIGFGLVLINTMPVWIGDLAANARLSDTQAGGIGSLVLLSAAVACATARHAERAGLAKIGVPVCLVYLALSPPLNAVFTLVACCILGLAIGSLAGLATRGLGSLGTGLRVISTAMTVGLVVSLIVYLVLPVLGLSSFWVLAVISLGLLAAPVQTSPTGHHVNWRSILADVPARYLPFFVLMGAYWTYLELFGGRFEDAQNLPFWLLASLVTGALGSILTSQVPANWRGRAQSLSMFAAALIGALSYVAPTLFLFGLTILLNGFALFLFFPLYLGTAGDRAPGAMAGYLLGFAIGGVAGAVLVHAAGYASLAAAILLSGIIGLLPRR